MLPNLFIYICGDCDESIVVEGVLRIEAGAGGVFLSIGCLLRQPVLVSVGRAGFWLRPYGCTRQGLEF